MRKKNQPAKTLTPKEALKKMREAINAGRIEFANPFAEDALATMRMNEKDPDYGMFIDVDIRPFLNRQRRTFGFIIKWACKGIGFGEVAVVNDGEGKWGADTESMSKDFVVDALTWFVKNKVNVR